MASEPEEPARRRRAADGRTAPRRPRTTRRSALRAVPSLLAAMPGGAEVGTLVHRVLEATDFAADDLEAELAERLAARQAPAPASSSATPTPSSPGCARAIETPLGPLLGGDRALRDVARADRLDELDFELPLVGGDDPTARRSRWPRSPTCSRTHLPADDPLRGYAERLRDPRAAPSVRGYLTGSIDLVVRAARRRRRASRSSTTRPTGSAPPGEDLTAWHYRPAALAAAMQRAHYPLQALLYMVALHRYLRWRLPGYDADAQPRRRPLPVLARYDRPGHAACRRHPVRRVRLAAAGRARRGAERPPRPGRRA